MKGKYLSASALRTHIPADLVAGPGVPVGPFFPREGTRPVVNDATIGPGVTAVINVPVGKGSPAQQASDMRRAGIKSGNGLPINQAVTRRS